MVVDLVTTWAIPVREYSNDVDLFEMAAECRPSDPDSEPYYAIDGDVGGDGGEADGVVKRSLIDPSLDYREVDRFLY
jgi:hypothetical protein